MLEIKTNIQLNAFVCRRSSEKKKSVVNKRHRIKNTAQKNVKIDKFRVVLFSTFFFLAFFLFDIL